MSVAKLISLVAIVTISATNQYSSAIGLGKIDKQAVINRPLNIEIPLIGSSYDSHEIRASLANYQQHKRLGIDYPNWMPALDFNLVRLAEGPVLRVTTIHPIKEPLVNFIIRVDYKGIRYFKEIVLFLDPVDIAPSLDNLGEINSTSSLSGKAAITPDKPLTQTVSKNFTTQQSVVITVRQGQSLWSIAENWKIRGISLNQRMEAIFRTNKVAFINNNKNKLKQGARLTLSVSSLNSANGSGIQDNHKQAVSSLNKRTKPLISEIQTQDKELHTQLKELNAVIQSQLEIKTQLVAQLASIERQITVLKAHIKLQNQSTSTTVNPTKKNQTTNHIKPSEKLLDKKNTANSSQSLPYTNPIPSNWVTAIWLTLAIIIAYLISLISSKRRANLFARNLENKLEDMAYNEKKQKSQTPSVKELSIPKRLSTSVQIDYLNSAADFYLRCHRYDLVRELINESLIQFSGNNRIIRALNEIRSRIDIHLNTDIHSHVIEKLDMRKEEPIDLEPDSENMDEEFLKLWDKKVSSMK